VGYHTHAMCAAVAVVGLGCELDRLFSGQQPALPMPAPPVRDDLRDLYDVLAGAVRGGSTVIVVVGDWLPEETLRCVYTVRSLLDTNHVAIHVTDLPPLATSVLAALTAALVPYAASAGALAGALGAVERELIVLAWVGSVAGLRHPDVSMVDHARSLMPWTAFGVGLQPESFVAPVSGRTETVPLTACEQPIELLVATGEQAELGWIVEIVAPALGGVAVREIPATLHGAQWWGTAKLAEAVGVPTSLDWLAQLTLSHQVAPCGWCGEPIAHSPCPLCGEAAPFRARRHAAESPPSSDTLAAGVAKEPDYGA
jgi:hypothetical protein